MRDQPGTDSGQKKRLYEAVLSLRTVADCEAFFADLCTPAELHSLVERWRVARLVDRDIPYRKIHDETGVSTATVTRVARSLTYGTGYRLVLERLKKRKK